MATASVVVLGRHSLALVAACLALACTPKPPKPRQTPRSEPAPIPAVVHAVPLAPRQLAPVHLSEPDPPPVCPHRSLRKACLEFETVFSSEDEEYLVDELEDCGPIKKGMMPDGETRYHRVHRYWSETRTAHLLILESKGCFTLIGTLGWNVAAELDREVLSTKFKPIDLDDDGDEDEAVFRIVERLTDNGSTEIREWTRRTARYCRASKGRWTCTEALSGSPRPEDWPSP